MQSPEIDYLYGLHRIKSPAFLLPWYRELERQGLRPIFIQDSVGIYGLRR